MYPQRSVMTCGLATALEPPHFNHAPVRGATRKCPRPARRYDRFQSTHPRGVRLAVFRGIPKLFKVSIHAPAWGATHHLVMDALGMNRFQSTHPRGVRPVRRRGRRALPRVSIHAPAWGATCSNLEFLRRYLVSIHAPAWGATIRFMRRMGFIVFQSTHPRGVRRAQI